MRQRDLTTVLDAGCGTGQMAEHMAESGLDVTGVDLAPANVFFTQSRGIRAVVGDFVDLPFEDESFDAALAFNSLLHVPKGDLPGVISELRRIIAPGGLFMLVVWGGIDLEGPHEDDWLDPPRFFSFFTDKAFAEMPTPGFEVVATDFLHDKAEAAGLHPQVKLLEAV